MENFNFKIPALEQFRNLYKYDPPIFNDIPDKKFEMLSDLKYEIEEISNNTKKRTWRDVFLVTLGAVVGGLFNFMLNLFF